MSTREFTPAAGRLAGVGSYDLLIRLFTREQTWRPRLLSRIAPRAGERILEVGCGTGTFAIALKSMQAGASVVALDPDAKVLEIARAKADVATARVEFRQGFLDEAGLPPGSFDTVYCSLVLHQVPPSVKADLVAGMIALLKPGGRLHIADYAKQEGLMRLLFRLTVQLTDGIADTQPNADGCLEGLLRDSRLELAQSDAFFKTPSGRIALFSRTRA